jgi:hypothetical protein
METCMAEIKQYSTRQSRSRILFLFDIQDNQLMTPNEMNLLFPAFNGHDLFLQILR